MTENRIESLFEKKGDDPPPVDVIVLAIGLVGAAGYAFVLAVLVQFAGPVVEDGPNPQAIAGITYVAAGVGLLGLAVAIYGRRPVGWYGGIVAGALALVARLMEGVVLAPLAVVLTGLPLLLLAYLLARRDVFLG